MGGNPDFLYDANGNMTGRTDQSGNFSQVFDVENRLVSVVNNANEETTTFTYDASGQRVKTVEPNGIVTHYPFPFYEVENPGQPGEVKRTTYSLGGQTIALRVVGGSSPGLYYVHADHLGSTQRLSTSSGSPVLGSDARFLPFGKYRVATTADLTDRGFTGHLHNDPIGLVYMNARYYVPAIGRFASADTIVPDQKDPQAYNRYGYARNNPLIIVDPSGHCWSFASGIRNGALGAAICERLDMWLPTAGPRIDSPRVEPAPSDNDLTVWLVDQMVTNASDKAPVIRDYYHSLNPVKMAAATQVWTSLVQTGGVWDFKTDIRQADIIKGEERLITLGGHELNYQVVANIHFGFVGRAAGFGPGFLQIGAGLAQMADPKQGFKWERLPYYGDQPLDYWAANFGFFLYDEYGHHLDELTPEAFAEALDRYIAIFGEPPAWKQPQE